jgi:hypothetical protein
MEQIEKVTLKVICDSEVQAGLLRDLLLKVTPQFEGKVFIEVETTLKEAIERERRGK